MDGPEEVGAQTERVGQGWGALPWAQGFFLRRWEYFRTGYVGSGGKSTRWGPTEPGFSNLSIEFSLGRNSEQDPPVREHVLGDHGGRGSSSKAWAEERSCGGKGRALGAGSEEGNGGLRRKGGTGVLPGGRTGSPILRA